MSIAGHLCVPAKSGLPGGTVLGVDDDLCAPIGNEMGSVAGEVSRLFLSESLAAL